MSTTNAIPLTSSILIAQALGLQPQGVPAIRDANCTMCGADIHEGDPCAPFQVGNGFTDDLSLAARGSDVICGHCVHMTSAEGLRNTGYGVFSMDGTRPFRKWADIASALENPPQPPFVMTYATAKNQHMAWRAPVNLSRDVFYVRVGLRDLRIRHASLMQAVKDCVMLGTLLEQSKAAKAGAKTGGKGASKPAKAAGKTLPNPFLTLSSDLKDVSAGMIKPALLALLMGSEFREQMPPEELDQVDRAMQRTLSLTQGEVWALRFLLTPGAGSASATDTERAAK